METEDPQVGDEARYAWAQGRRSIRSVRQRMSELARQGRPITDEDVRNNNNEISRSCSGYWMTQRWTPRTRAGGGKRGTPPLWVVQQL